MNRKITGLVGLFFLSGVALALALTFLAGGTGSAGAQGSGGEEKGYAEGEGSTAAGARIQAQPAARDYLEGEGGQSGMKTGLNSETLSWPEAASDSMQLVYRFNGVTDDGQKGSGSRKNATSVHCTNISPSLAQIEVQVYQWDGSTVYTATLPIDVNRSATISTQNTGIYFEDAILGGSTGTNAIFQGSGQIFSSTPAIICTAQALDPLNTPPVFATSLEMYKQ